MDYEKRHSRFVSGAKLVLPLAALILLSTLFLFSNRIDPSAAIPYAKVDVEKLARESALTQPDFSGVTQDGGTLSVIAQQALPDMGNGAGAVASDLAAKLTSKTGLVTDLNARQGRFQPSISQVTLKGSVAMQTSKGYRMNSDLMTLATDRDRIISPGPVHGDAPYGTLDAGAMQMTTKDNGATHDLVFNKGVKLVYQPKQ